ncbi:hypothetical protein [Breznakiella homolactica]|uniref:Type II secretion system protein K n=1 Tax=Breznakiella homolactica TaxID=2798577 RepID=A0A7T8BBU4_9SPIR|nr:hypothetical protein [Breznakiella homolactica]QQO10746.1 hypothetical protein JFL75_07475 [Breznakiella homolactica]
MSHNEGAVEFGAVIILFFLAAILAGGSLYTAVTQTYVQRNTNEFRGKLDSEILLKNIVADMQELTGFEYDAADSAVLDDLRVRYSAYGLEITDVSSGYHLDFLSDGELADEKLSKFIFINDTAADFIDWRDLHGLSVKKDQWKSFVKEEAWDACVSYGWVPETQTDSFAYRFIVTSFNTTSYDRLFPLINDFPMMNVNMIDPEILVPLVTRGSFKIERAEHKMELLANRLREGPMGTADISSLLDVPVTHDIFDYLGTKTAFWRISFSAKKGLFTEAVAAAIPVRDGKRQEISEYKLVGRRFIHEP